MQFIILFMNFSECVYVIEPGNIKTNVNISCRNLNESAIMKSVDGLVEVNMPLK